MGTEYASIAPSSVENRHEKQSELTLRALLVTSRIPLGYPLYHRYPGSVHGYAEVSILQEQEREAPGGQNKTKTTSKDKPKEGT